MKRITQAVGLAIIASGVSGCGLFGGDDGYLRNRSSDYLKASVEQPTELPEGMQATIADPLLPVPEHVADTKRTKRTRAPRPEPLPTGEEAVDFLLLKTDEISWVVAQRLPAQVWPSVQAFFAEQGFKVDERAAYTGELVTPWQGASELEQSFVNQVGLPQTEQVRYRVRVEPGVQRNTSELFLDAARSSTGSDSAAWSAAEADTALALMRQYLQDASESKDSYSLLASRNYDAPKRVAMVDFPNGTKALRLDASFDRAWFGVGRALASADIHVEEVDRQEQVYIIEPDRPEKEEPIGFFDALFTALQEIEKELELDKQRPQEVNEEDQADLYRLRLTAIEHQVFVSLESDTAELADPELTERVLDAVQKQLN